MSLSFVLRATLLVLSLSGAMLLGRAIRPREARRADAGDGSLRRSEAAAEVEALRLRIVLLSKALEVGARPCVAPRDQETPAPPPSPAAGAPAPEARAGAADGVAPELYLRGLARTLSVPVTPESLMCTTDSCRMEVDLRGGPERYAALQNLVARAADRLPQSVIESDATGAKAVVVLARAAPDLATAAGGAEAAFPGKGE